MSIFEIIIAIVAFLYFMVAPFFSGSQYKCEYRTRCTFAQILWIAALLLALFIMFNWQFRARSITALVLFYLKGIL